MIFNWRLNFCNILGRLLNRWKFQYGKDQYDTEQKPCLQARCICSEYSHLHNVCAPSPYEQLSLSTFLQANAIKLVPQLYQEMPKVHLVPEGEGSTNLPAGKSKFWSLRKEQTERNEQTLRRKMYFCYQAMLSICIT